ncbi:XRE family transcriptional regulator [Burkholderia sp. WAC0059]|uniref:helix-turn-helix domain-containing protein n=1 Tax=Burkholderia sp. WAC0059 TaxID=2066022 RepID=UPI000C7EE9E0|nr:helix-turn-helix transcriptional regulator [Burkholderia sp. WAC0059]PLZ02929.1 XRE family transcriptional regulator [Burkholderia sp. WAC0059]
MSRHSFAFGRALRQLRKARGLTQESLAFDSRLDRGYISILESGRCSPTLGTMISLCKALDISLTELAAETERQQDASGTYSAR